MELGLLDSLVRPLVQFLEPWYEDSSAALAEELRLEAPPGHVLHGVSVSTRARRQDQDDVLFELMDGTARFAVVHLTYSRESDPRWPRTRLFANADAWLVSIHDDHAESGG